MRQAKSVWIWLLCVIIGALVLMASFDLDGVVHRWQYEHRWKNVQVLSRNLTRTTDWPAHFAIGLLGASIAWFRGNKKWTRIFLAMLVATALAGASAEVLKRSTGRVRPYVKLEKTWAGPTNQQNFHSFPSGHTAASFAFWSVLCFANWRIALLCLPIPLFVGFTRIFLGAHYFSDVIGAALVGILSAAVVAHLMLRRVEQTGRRSQIS